MPFSSNLPLPRLTALTATILVLLFAPGCDREELFTTQAPCVNCPGGPVPLLGKPKDTVPAGDAKETPKPDTSGDTPKSDLPKSEIPVSRPGYLIDGFEGPEHTVWSFDSADDEGVAQYVEKGATQGKKALRITIRDKGKTGKMNLRRDAALDLSHAASLLLDIDSPSDKIGIAIGLISAPHDISQESKVINLKKGLNKDVRISFTGKDWKNEKSKWEYTAAPVNLQSVQRLNLFIFTNGESSGALTLDNLRAEPDESPLLTSGSLVRREWRPEVIGVTGIPKVVSQYQGIEAAVFFRASYKDFFDANDISAGFTIYSPSGKTLDARGFFAGMMPAPREARVEDSAEAPPPLWGPADDEDPTAPKPDGGARRGRRRGEAKADTPKDDAPKTVEVPKDPAAEAAKKEADAKAAEAAQKKLELRVRIRNAEVNNLPVWLVRFTPFETGQYTLQLYVRNSAGETRTEERKLTVLPENRLMLPGGRKGGNVRVSKRDPRQFELNDGSPFFMYGQNVCWTKNWTPYLDAMHAYGANTVRVWFCPWGLNIERKNEPGSYDLDEASRLDKLLDEAEERSIRVIVCFTFHGMTQSNWGDSPYNSVNGGPCGRPEEFFTNWRARNQFKRLLSYSAARWGSSPALLSWELCNEIDLAKYVWPDEVIRWSREMAGHLKNVDMHGHLVTVSATTQGFPLDLWTDSRIDWVQIHSYGPDVSNLLFERLSPLQNLPKPVVLGEFGSGTESRDDIPDKDGARLQAALWLSICSPSAGAAMPWWWDTYIEARDLYPVLAAPRRFVAGDDRRGRYGTWVRKIYEDNVEVAGAMDSQGGRFYVHKPEWTLHPENRRGSLLAKAQTIELTGLNDGAYSVEFWDAKDGKVFAKVDATVRDGKLPITLSVHPGEFAFKLERSGRSSLGLK